MPPKCWDCGRFIAVGLGDAVRILRTNGHEQFFCSRCLEKGAKLKDGSIGTEFDRLKEQPWVKEFEVV